MSCYAHGRCCVCARRHTLPLFASREKEHDFIQKANFKLIVLNTVCNSCVIKIETHARSCPRLSDEKTIKSEPNENDRSYELAIADTFIDKSDSGESLQSEESPMDRDEYETEFPIQNEIVHVQQKLCNGSAATIVERQVNTTLRVEAERNNLNFSMLQAIPATFDDSPLNAERSDNTRRKRKCLRLFCDFCQKEFTHTGDFNKHRRKHTGEQPYTCPNCPQRFSHASNLARHQRVHSGEKPFSCKRCGRNFARKDKLSRHLLAERCTALRTMKY